MASTPENTPNRKEVNEFLMTLLGFKVVRHLPCSCMGFCDCQYGDYYEKPNGESYASALEFYLWEGFGRLVTDPVVSLNVGSSRLDQIIKAAMPFKPTSPIDVANAIYLYMKDRQILEFKK